MQITATSTTGSTTAATKAASDVSAINGSDFMTILIKQLEMQDPFEPMTNQEMISQMSTIRELEMNTKLSDRLSQLTDQQGFSSAAGLIGKQVKGTVTDADGNEYEMAGVVTGVEFSKTGDALLQLDSGQKLPITGLKEVSEVTAQTQA
jgi:flagellar basal-body rod modification protein FlgD